MTNLENKIPIKGYATFHPLKHCLIGAGFDAECFADLPIYKNNKIMDPLKRIAEETEEDYEALEKILKDAGVNTYRAKFDIGKIKSLKNIYLPPMTPRDYFAVIGEKIYASTKGATGYYDVLKQIDRKNLEMIQSKDPMSTANITRVGKDVYWDQEENNVAFDKVKIDLQQQGFRIHNSYRGYHSDAVYCVVRPGCIVSLQGIQNYKELFPGWDVLYVSDKSWSQKSPFQEIKSKVGGRWWLKGEEHNDQLITFINTWLNEWVGYVEETVFDVNMLSIDENTIICNNHNKEMFNFLKKRKVEPIIFNFRHKHFWDGGIHCVTQDLYREGIMEDYFG